MCQLLRVESPESAHSARPDPLDVFAKGLACGAARQGLQTVGAQCLPTTQSEPAIMARIHLKESR